MQLKRLILALVVGACMLLPLQCAKAQSSFDKGSHTLGGSLCLSVGPIPIWELPLPFLRATYEYCVVDSIFSNGKGSLGVGAHGEFVMGLGIRSTTLFFCSMYTYWAGLTSFHYEFLPRLDTYITPSVGFASYASEMGYGSFDYPYFNWDITTGTRYYFTSHFAAGLEYSWTWISARLGLTYQF